MRQGVEQIMDHSCNTTKYTFVGLSAILADVSLSANIANAIKIRINVDIGNGDGFFLDFTTSAAGLVLLSFRDTGCFHIDNPLAEIMTKSICVIINITLSTFFTCVSRKALLCTRRLRYHFLITMQMDAACEIF